MFFFSFTPQWPQTGSLVFWGSPCSNLHNQPFQVLLAVNIILAVASWRHYLSLLATQVSVKPAVSTGWVQEGPWLYEAPCFQAFRLFHLIYFKTHLICRLSCRKKKPSLHLTSWIYFSPSSVFLVSKTVDTGWVLEVPLVTRIAPWFHEWGTCGFERVHFWADTGRGKSYWTLLGTKQDWGLSHLGFGIYIYIFLKINLNLKW